MSISALFQVTERSAIPAPASRPSIWPATRMLMLDPWLLTASILTFTFVAFPDLGGSSLTLRSYVTDYLSTIMLLGLAITAVFLGVRRRKFERERLFWRLIGISLGAWLIGEITALVFYDVSNPFTLAAVDALYLCYYLAFTLALDLQPQFTSGQLQIRPLRVLGSAGRVLFLSGLFLYFVILPSTLGIDEFLTWVPSFSLYVALDLYLVSRAFQELRHAATPQSRLIYGLLLAALSFALITDSLDLAWIASYLPSAFPRVTDFLWYAPMVLIVAAVRSGSFAADEGSTVEINDDDDQVRGVPLLVYSVGLALLHLLLALTPHAGGSLQFARIILVMVWLILFGMLNLVQNSIIQREVRQQSRQRLAAEQHIRDLSRLDPLTGLLNRRALEEELARAVARANRSGMPLGLMFIDLDDFKVVNDTWGHAAGDSVLREAAARIKALTRDVDSVARYGGDEFVLIFEALEHPSGAEIVGQRILDGFKMGFQFESGRINLSASIGIAMHPANGRNPDSLFESADRAMYTAKQRGGSDIEFA
jgi:diguanylate cyclase (GGDEF)-like protein